MNILIFGANWFNHGDEAAIRAMIDELRTTFPDCKMKIQFNQAVNEIPYPDIEILQGFTKPVGRNKLKLIPYNVSICTGGKINWVHKQERAQFCSFVEAVVWADYAIYAPGGPSIGDHYHQYQLVDMMRILVKYSVPYAIFAPSIGPFSNYRKAIKRVLDRADIICFREAVSQGYYKQLCPMGKSTVTLDSAFQHPVDINACEETYKKYRELKSFLEKHEYVVGITITDLKWHKDYRNTAISNQIKDAFAPFVQELAQKNYGVLFIPQLFGRDNDVDYMNSFSSTNCFVMDEKYDCYFQQHIISKLYAVVGMRYHSNIFSAKMGTPFVSVAYEQKMIGFMKKAGLEKYCINATELSYNRLIKCFGVLESNYEEYSKLLATQKNVYSQEAHVTTQLVSKSISKKVGLSKK